MHPSDHADGLLMQKLAAGDCSALDALIERWQAPLLSFNYRYVQDRAVARELTQETFVRLYRSCARYKTQQRFSSWLFKIAANLCKNHQRWRRRHPEESLFAVDDDREERLPEALHDHDDPARQALSAEESERVRLAVYALPHALKVAVLLHYYDGLSYKEISTVLGCSERGVETRLYRARKQLAESLELDADEGPTPIPPPKRGFMRLLSRKVEHLEACRS